MARHPSARRSSHRRLKLIESMLATVPGREVCATSVTNLIRRLRFGALSVERYRTCPTWQVGVYVRGYVSPWRVHQQHLLPHSTCREFGSGCCCSTHKGAVSGQPVAFPLTSQLE